MKAYKKIIGTAFVAVCLIIVIVTFIKVKGINSSDKLVLQLAHNQSAGSEIADSIAKVSDFAAKESGDEVNIKIFASGVLGTEKEEIEMVKAGIIDMAKVSSNTLGQFDDRYAIFAIPYLFKNQEHYYNAMENSEAVKELFADALLEPESLRNLQNEGRFTELMAAQEELKIMPFGDIWREYLNRENVAADYVSEVMDYEKKVLEAR